MHQTFWNFLKKSSLDEDACANFKIESRTLGERTWRSFSITIIHCRLEKKRKLLECLVENIVAGAPALKNGTYKEVQIEEEA